MFESECVLLLLMAGSLGVAAWALLHALIFGFGQ